MKPYTSHELIGLLHAKLEEEAFLRFKKRIAKRIATKFSKPMNGKAAKRGKA